MSARLAPSEIDPPRSSVVLSVAHAGRDYARFAHLLCLPATQLIPLEDRYADRLVDLAVGQKVPAIIATMPRAWIDMNRAADDLDSRMIENLAPSALSRRAAGGLGLIPRHVGGRVIWRRRLTREDLAARERTYRQFHGAIATALARAKRRFGHAVLLDVHSMPPLDAVDAPSIVFGDRFGRSASSALLTALLLQAHAAGHLCALNAPYAGGSIIAQHGRPADGVHAIQIEIDRRLYLDDSLTTPRSIEPIQRLIAAFATSASRALSTESPAIAAE